MARFGWLYSRWLTTSACELPFANKGRYIFLSVCGRVRVIFCVGLACAWRVLGYVKVCDYTAAWVLRLSCEALSGSLQNKLSLSSLATLCGHMLGRSAPFLLTAYGPRELAVSFFCTVLFLPLKPLRLQGLRFYS